MNVHDLTVERLARRASPSRTASPPVDGSQQVYDFEAARRARDGRIPDEALVEVDAAARLYHELRAGGRQLRFDLHEASGQVAVSLCDLDGKVLRRVSLTDVVTLTVDPDPAA